MDKVRKVVFEDGSWWVIDCIEFEGEDRMIDWLHSFDTKAAAEDWMNGM